MQFFCRLAALSLLLASCSEKPSAPGGSSSSSSAKINDPSGIYTPRCDASITRHPAENITMGNGQVVEFHYDGSKGEGLTYDLFYVNESGDVKRLNAASLDKKADGVYARDIKVFDSDAHKRPGFMEIGTTANTAQDASGVRTAKFVSLGMFPVVFEVGGK